MKRTAKRTFVILILLTLLGLAFVTIVYAPAKAKPNVESSARCQQVCSGDTSLQQIACGVYGSSAPVLAVKAPEDKAVKAGDGKSEDEQPPVLVVVPAPRPPETIVTPPPAKEREKGGDRHDDDDKKCSRQDNDKKHGDHNCGKGSGGHDKDKDGKDHNGCGHHEKGKGRDKDKKDK